MSVKRELIGNLKQNFAQCVFNQQVYESAATREGRKEMAAKGVDIALIACTLASLTFSEMPNWIGQLAGVVEITLQFAVYHYGVGKISAQYRETARQYLELRDLYLNLLTDYQANFINESVARKKRDELTRRYCTISSVALQTKSSDYANAQRKLGTKNYNNRDNGEAYTWSNAEINRFLPEELQG